MQPSAAIAAALLAAPFLHASAYAQSVQATSADAFVERIGVNIHTHYQGTVYDHPLRTQETLLKLGVRHVRDGLVDSTWPEYYERLNGLGRAGIHATLICGPPVGRVLPVAAKLAEAIEAFEGPNEVNLNQWTPERASRFQQDLWTTVRADAAWAAKPIVCLSVTDYDYGVRLGDLAAYADFGNLHPYPGGWEPENTAAWMKADLPTALAGGRRFTGARPLVITETGYTTHQAKAGHVAVTPEMAGIYLPRLLLHTAASGVQRTFLYELFDLHDNAQEPEDNFGLVRSDGVTCKPAGTALMNLTALLRDPGPAFATGTLEFQLSEPAAHSLLLQKRDGTFLLALWLPSNLWDHARPYGQKHQEDPPDLPCTITLAKPAGALSALGGLDTTPTTTPLPAGASIVLTLSERVTFLRIVP